MTTRNGDGSPRRRLRITAGWDWKNWCWGYDRNFVGSGRNVLFLGPVHFWWQAKPRVMTDNQRTEP